MPSGPTAAGGWVARVTDLCVTYHLGTFDTYAEAEREGWLFKIENGIPIHPGRAAAEARRILSSEAFQQQRLKMLNQAKKFRDKTYMPTERDLPRTNGHAKKKAKR